MNEIFINKQKIGEVFAGKDEILSIYKGKDLVWFSTKMLFAEGTPGTYTFVAPFDCEVSLILVAGGGGSANNSGSRNGGSGGMITGKMRITKGTEYPIVVGGGGAGRDVGGGVTGGGATGDTGGSSSAFGNTATGGTGGHAHYGYWATSYYDGAGGSGTAVEGFTVSNGVNGSTASRYQNFGGGGTLAGNGQNGCCFIQVCGI